MCDCLRCRGNVRAGARAAVPAGPCSTTKGAHLAADHREHPRQASYLLRLWQAEAEGRVIWRASLQSPGTGDRLGFATLSELLSFLELGYGPVDRAESSSQGSAE